MGTSSIHNTKPDPDQGTHRPRCRSSANSPQGEDGGSTEVARKKMVEKNPYKYGSITKVPQFILEKDFIKHTPYSERSNEDDILFWAKMPFHLEYLKANEEELEHILAFMYRMKRLQGLFGEAAFYHRNPGMDSTAGEREILAGVLMRHIAMVRSTSRVLPKGLTKPDCPHILH